ncbi:MAG: hypothetical protein A2Z83_00390 [Omnitrophica bacterium GWA2_52_8]|nr:MAG: hypothetical protein A2Z83_00390 [Omnitrophica bacterium GWA2_52_8]
MMRLILIIAAALGLGFLGLTLTGHKFHPENFKYYAPQPEKEPLLKVVLKTGQTLEAKLVQETQSEIRLNYKGIITAIPKSKIDSSQQLTSNPITNYIEQVRRENALHPLFSSGSAKPSNVIPGSAATAAGTTPPAAGVQNPLDGYDQTSKQLQDKVGDIRAEAEKRQALLDQLAQ